MSIISKRLLGAAVVALGVLGAASPAQAVTLDFRTLYLFDDAGYEGAKVPVQTLEWNELGQFWVYRQVSKPEFPTFNDKTSSLINNDWRAWVVFDDKNYQDRRYCIRPGETVPNLSAQQFKFNDKISSALRLEGASCAGYPAFFTTG
ncbi:hypothetical protein [Herbidospora yilanensis]|uniref:hypothetical protein n=1 Tax=Herbidospora yilanensis TaxID=354426 RepID=UPI000781F489|nr:hypothetical protein [Herbidospora yilanensis]